MKLEHIKEILQTVRFYNTVNITQTFCKEGKNCITVKCVKNKSILQITFIQTGHVVFFDSIDQAAQTIECNINSSTLV